MSTTGIALYYKPFSSSDPIEIDSWGDGGRAFAPFFREGGTPWSNAFYSLENGLWLFFGELKSGSELSGRFRRPTLDELVEIREGRVHLDFGRQWLRRKPSEVPGGTWAEWARGGHLSV